MSAGASALGNENYYVNSTQEEQESNKYKVKGEGENVTHDDFLMLLVTQMQNQDPLSPMQDTDMMAQFAQMQQLDNQTSMTKAMVQMSKEYAVQGASSMIGKYVYTETENGSTNSGEVVQTKLSDDDTVQLVLDNGSTVEYSDVVKVEDIEEAPSIQDASGMMQKYVLGVDENGDSFEGIVKNVTTQGSVIYIETYEGDFIPMDGVAQIRELTATENNELQEALTYVNQYVECPREDEDGNPDGVTSGIVKEIYRRDGQYWAETWGGQGIYLNDISMSTDLTTDEMAKLEQCKEYTNRIIKANDGRMQGLAEGFFYKDGEFYMYTAHSEAVHVDDIYLTRDPTPQDMMDFGSTDGMEELDLLNLQKAIEEYLGKEYTGYDEEAQEQSGVITSVYFDSPNIMFRLDTGADVVSPASIIANGGA